MRATKILAVLVLALAGCPKRVVVVNGREMETAQATDLARRDLEAVRRSTLIGRFVEVDDRPGFHRANAGLSGHRVVA